MIRGLDKGQKAALLISECQRGVIEAGLSPFAGLAAQARERGIGAKIAALAETFRARRQPVFHLHVAHRPDFADLKVTNLIMGASSRGRRMVAGSADAEPVPELAPHPHDYVHARSFSLIGFHGTELDQTLRNMGVETLVLAGVSTNVALNGLAVCGSDLGYQIVIPEDCTAGASAESHAFMVRELLPLYATLTTAHHVADALASGVDRQRT